MNNVKHLITSLLIILSISLSAQNGEIKGKVTDRAGQPVSNANISITDTKLGSSTNDAGLLID